MPAPEHKSAAGRPPVAIGHVRLAVSDVPASIRFFADQGVRTIVSRGDFAVMELRGGTHLVLREADAPIADGTKAPFDLMVDDVDAAHRDATARNMNPSPIARGRIHDNFTVREPSGYVLTINSSHTGNRAV